MPFWYSDWERSGVPRIPPQRMKSLCQAAANYPDYYNDLYEEIGEDGLEIAWLEGTMDSSDIRLRVFSETGSTETGEYRNRWDDEFDSGRWLPFPVEGATFGRWRDQLTTIRPGTDWTDISDIPVAMIFPGFVLSPTVKFYHWLACRIALRMMQLKIAMCLRNLARLDNRGRPGSE